MKTKTISKAVPASPSLKLKRSKAGRQEKSFDAVKTMRDIRDQLSKEIMNMTFAEEKAYLKKLLAKKPVKAS